MPLTANLEERSHKIPDCNCDQVLLHMIITTLPLQRYGDLYLFYSVSSVGVLSVVSELPDSRAAK